MLTSDFDCLRTSQNTICVVGAGPVGISAALELEKLGHQVLLLESGLVTSDKHAQELSDAIRTDVKHNVEMSLAVQRSFGGTSNLWGAGCIPLDPIDFEARNGISSDAWPISYQEFLQFIPAACKYAGCGDQFDDLVSIRDMGDDGFNTSKRIRFANPSSFDKAYRKLVNQSKNITALVGATVSTFRFEEDGRLTSLLVKNLEGGEHEVFPRITVLACGGVETTRLLLSTQIESSNRFGGLDGPLGRYYMGHLSGVLADIQFSDATSDRSLGFIRDTDKSYYRRRIVANEKTQRSENLTNISFWPTLPQISNPDHHDPVLSAIYLALSSQLVGRMLLSESLRKMNVGDGNFRSAHVKNVMKGLPSVYKQLVPFLFARYLKKPHMPGLHFNNPANRYTLRYHAEHLPNLNSRIKLSNLRDRLGNHKVELDLRFSSADALPIVRTHELLENWVRKSGLGKLIWRVEKTIAPDHVLEVASDGVHQIGTARMGLNERTAVVDRDCRTFGCNNLFIASSAVFPTSGQANPTLSAIALGIRVARQIGKEAMTHTTSHVA